MATLEQRLELVFQAIGADDKTQRLAIGVLSSLNTTEKSSLVWAINELVTLISAKATINDSASSVSTTYSSAKIAQMFIDLIWGAGASSDTLKELADQIASNLANDAFAVSAWWTQSFTTPQKAQARANIWALSTTEIWNPDTDLVAIYNTAKA